MKLDFMREWVFPPPLSADIDNPDFTGYEAVEILAQGRIYEGYYRLYDTNIRSKLPSVTSKPDGKTFVEWVESLSPQEQKTIENSWLAHTRGYITK